MPYRVALPASPAPDRPVSVVYLLHGGGGGVRDWSNRSDVARFVGRNLLLVMPEGDYSYYVNAAEPPGNRYEDYIVQDLISDVEARFPVAKEREDRAIVGVSMGGFGAIKLALSHPDRFAFCGALSPAIDVARRPFSMRRMQQSWTLSSIFGPWGSPSRRNNDPFLIVPSLEPASAPYFFLSCGASEGLLSPNRDFAALLTSRQIKHEFHVVPGGHDWEQWNRQLPALFEQLWGHTNKSPS